MEEKENFCFETLKTPLTTRIKEGRNGSDDNVARAESGAGLVADPDAPKKDTQPQIIRWREVEVEITNDRPTATERKAVEDFFDWLLAEALRLNGEMGKAA